MGKRYILKSDLEQDRVKGIMMGENYTNNHLTDVILRIDFPNTPLNLTGELPATLTRKILESYPIFEKKEYVQKSLTISANKPVDEVSIDVIEWVYYGPNRERLLCLSDKYLYLNYKTWDSNSFNTLKGFFFILLDELFDLNHDLQVTRLGLRYINNIKFDDKNIFAWKSYLDKNLLHGLDFIEEKSAISRAFGNLELNYGDQKVRFQYGMHNPDYPATIKKKLFVLDYDAYCVGTQDKEEIKASLISLHDKIIYLFESSIKENLRKKMRE